MAGKGGRQQRFSKLQKDTALRLLAENFGTVDDILLMRIEQAIGRRPNPETLRVWIRGRSPAKKASSVGARVDAGRVQQTAMASNDANVLDVEKSLVVVEVANIDTRTHDEKVYDLLDVLIDIPPDQIRKQSPDRRMRSYVALKDQHEKTLRARLIYQYFQEVERLVEVCQRRGYNPQQTLLDVAWGYDQDDDHGYPDFPTPLIQEFKAVLERKGFDPVKRLKQIIVQHEQMPDVMGGQVALPNGEPIVPSPGNSENLNFKLENVVVEELD